ncbi:hypothetical protein [Actinoplanes awajinensis]|nr:hypothetical protein [Actinoplanes awajinensis]
MVIVVLLWLAAVATGVWAIWPVAASSSSPAPAAPPEPLPAPVSLEGVLAGQVIRREITCGQYRRALERLAIRDDERHPMSVPDDSAG